MPLQLPWSERPSRNGSIHWSRTPFGEIKIRRRLYLQHYVWQVSFPDGSIKREDILVEAMKYAEAWVETKLLEAKLANPSS